jgi:ribosomal protein S17
MLQIDFGKTAIFELLIIIVKYVFSSKKYRIYDEKIIFRVG